MKKPVKVQPRLLIKCVPGEVILARELKLHSLSVLRENTVEYLPGSAVGVERRNLNGTELWRHVRRQDDLPIYHRFFSLVRHLRYGFAVVFDHGWYFHIRPDGKAAYRWRFSDVTDVSSEGIALVQHPQRSGWHCFHVARNSFADGWTNKK